VRSGDAHAPSCEFSEGAAMPIRSSQSKFLIAFALPLAAIIGLLLSALRTPTLAPDERGAEKLARGRSPAFGRHLDMLTRTIPGDGGHSAEGPGGAGRSVSINAPIPPTTFRSSGSTRRKPPSVRSSRAGPARAGTAPRRGTPSVLRARSIKKHVFAVARTCHPAMSRLAA